MASWNSIVGLIEEIKRSEGAGATMSAVAMAYICIDTMALLAIQENKTSQTRDDFISWVDTYLKAHDEQPYQYRGIDVYAGRCAVLHAFGSEADCIARIRSGRQIVRISRWWKAFLRPQRIRATCHSRDGIIS